ncbi:P-loop containing nucleoside triphosphate hydrolase protein [Pilaira anomala]|nr:P-loop containing nucleoside triphosphate hydrolase protein [Pilaira anomala]
MDFGGLVLKTIELLRSRQIGSFQSVDCVLVDEFQDTSSAQYELIKQIMAQSTHKEITVVGDPDQSIYGWRSAKSKVFAEMQNDFEGSEVINLEQNYRSSAKVVKAASYVIEQDTERMTKALYTNNPVGPPIALIDTINETKQAVFVATEIEKVVACSNGLIQYKNIAVLMRANFISEKFERIFRACQIPFHLKGGERFFNRMEVKDMLAYLKLSLNPFDLESFKRVINVPKRNIRVTTINTIQDLSMVHQVSVLDGIDLFLNGSNRFFLSDRKELTNFVGLCKEVRSKIEDKANVSDILKFIYEDIGYYTYLRSNYFKDHVARLKNISELVTMSESKSNMFDETCSTTVVPNSDMVTKAVKEEEEDIELSQIGEDATMGDSEDAIMEDSEDATSKGSQEIKKFLDYCDSCLNEKKQVEKKGGKVTLSTIHASKGLEWPCVFVVTCVEGVIPASGGEINEEKRILYVAMTRAKFFLYCVSPLTIGDWGLSKPARRSPFLENMTEDLYTSDSPVWNQELLTMLASIIQKEVPNKNDFKQSSGIPKSSSSSQPIPRTTSTTNTPPSTPFTFYQPYSSSSSPKTRITTAPTYTHASQQYASSSSSSGLKRSLNDEDTSEDWLTITIKKEPKNDDEFDF